MVRNVDEIASRVLPVLPLVVSYLFFPGNIWYIAASVLVLVPAYAYLGWDGRVNLAYGICLMVIAAVMIGYRETFANQILQYSFWFILAGVSCQIIDFIRNARK